MPRITSKPKPIRTHYAIRLVHSVRHMGETVWQPLCAISDVSKITMTTVLGKVTCHNCRTKLSKHHRKLGISRQINRLRRAGTWREDLDTIE